MCGLFGLVANKLADADELAAAFTVLAAFNMSRGEDGWGLWHGVNVLVREAGPPRDTFRLARNALRERPTWPLCGHTRFATSGEPCARNAHPFIYDNQGTRYVAAHNGGVRPSAHAPNAAHRTYAQQAVDSAAFYEALFLHNVKASAWEGYGVFVWTEQAHSAKAPKAPKAPKARGGTPTMHVGRSPAAELAMVTLQSDRAGTVTLWSSEATHLRDAVRIAMRPARATWHDISPGYWQVEAAGPVCVVNERDARYDFEGMERTYYRLSDSLWNGRIFSSSVTYEKANLLPLVHRRRRRK